jgi:hypothetical protein
MNKRKASDMKFGERTEKVFLKFINNNEFKDNKLIKAKSKTSVFDFSNENHCVELKGRTNTYKEYQTTMVGYNKVQVAEKDKTDKKYIFFFLFTDGLYKWDFNKDEFQVKKGGRYDRGRPEFKDYSYIDIDYLKLVTETINSKTLFIEEVKEENPNLIYSDSDSDTISVISSNLE